MNQRAGCGGFWDRFLSSSQSPSYHSHLGRRPSSNWFWSHGLGLSNRLWLWAVPCPCLFLSRGLYPFLYLFLCGCCPASLGPGTILAACTHAGFPGVLVVCSLLGLFAFSGAFRLWGPFAVIIITLIKKSLGRQGGHAASALEGQHGVRLKHRS